MNSRLGMVYVCTVVFIQAVLKILKMDGKEVGVAAIYNETASIRKLNDEKKSRECMFEKHTKE